MIKNLFSTPKKAAVTVLCALAILTAVGTGTAFAVSAVAESTSIGADKAKMFAFADAGVDPVTAENVRTEFDFEQGHFIYDVEFTANGTEYGYWIQASDGSVVKKKIELIGAGGSKTGITAAITQKDARKIALEDAGLTEAEVTISAEKLDTENGVAVYEVDFVKGNVKYEYDINATTGAVYTKSSESTALPSTEAAAQPSETAAAAANVTAAATEASRGFIGVDRAKSIALGHAGVSASSVSFSKAKLDDDDGRGVYEIEFYVGNTEYDYEIDAHSGAILEASAEND